MSNEQSIARKNYTTLVVLLGIAILLPLFLSTPGAIAGLVLAPMVAGWLVAAKDTALQNRHIVLGIPVIVILVSAILTVSALLYSGSDQLREA